jgi:hypothetical protein
VRPGTDLAQFVGGFVAAEGTFIRSGQPPRFRFAVALGTTDAETCHMLAAFFGVGSLTEWPRRKAHYQDEISFIIQSLRDHLAVTIPFMDEHLPESHKRVQYLAWRAKLLDYWEHEAKRVRPCTVEGCESPRRAHGVCRQHLYARHGV